MNYGKARVDAAVRDAGKVLDRKEAELEADQADQPWLSSDRDVPTFDEAKARIEGRSGPPSPPPDDAKVAEIRAFDLAKQQQAADARLASIRESLGITPDPPKPDPPKA